MVENESKNDQISSLLSGTTDTGTENRNYYNIQFGILTTPIGIVAVCVFIVAILTALAFVVYRFSVRKRRTMLEADSENEGSPDQKEGGPQQLNLSQIEMSGGVETMRRKVYGAQGQEIYITEDSEEMQDLERALREVNLTTKDYMKALQAYRTNQ